MKGWVGRDREQSGVKILFQEIARLTQCWLTQTDLGVLIEECVGSVNRALSIDSARVVRAGDSPPMEGLDGLRFGSLVVEGGRRRYGPDEVDFLRAVANLLDLAIGGQQQALAVARIQRLRSLLRQCLQALLRAASENEFLLEMCRTLVAGGDCPLVWLASDSPDGTGLTPLAQASDDPGKEAWAQDHVHLEVASLALRTARIQLHESFACLPLVADGQTLGVISLFFQSDGAPDPTLLSWLADDLALSLLTWRAAAGQRSRLASILESTSDAIVAITLEGVVTDWNQGAERAYGYTRSEMIGHPISRIVPWERTPEVALILHKIQRGGKTVQFDTVRVTKDGRKLDAWLSVSALRDFRGQIVGCSMIARDTTASTQTERELIQNQAQLASVIETAMHAIISVDHQQRVILYNRAAERMFDRPASRAVGGSLEPLFAASFRQHLSLLGETVQDRLETFGLRADGEQFPLEAAISQLTVNGQKLYTLIVRDLTLQKALEEQLRQSQKLEALGQLAGGIAHDFNNLLMVILGYTDDSMVRTASRESLKHNLGEIHQAASRAAALTGQLLTFSRKQILMLQELSLNQVVSDLHKMLERLIGENICLHTNLSARLPRIRADQSQIQQVILNLVVNARDAMPEGGQLHLETQEVHLDDEYVASHLGVKPGDYIMLAVTDTGAGMTRETQKRIFEPFFTTKGIGQGTGLGLSTAFGIVKQAEGHILVYSEVGRGSVFKVYLPSLPTPDSDRCTGRVAPPTLQTGSETILMVEDDKPLRRLMTRILRDSGYNMLVASDGASALSIVRQHPEKIDLLLTDVVMPGMSGRVLAETLQGSRSDLKVVYMSGYTSDAIVRLGIVEGQADFIQKPFSPAVLQDKVRQVLDGA